MEQPSNSHEEGVDLNLEEGRHVSISAPSNLVGVLNSSRNNSEVGSSGRILHHPSSVVSLEGATSYFTNRNQPNYLHQRVSVSHFYFST
jgi:hypothetical protein